MNVEFLVLPNGRCPVEEFLEELDDKSLAKVYRLIEILKKQGSLPFPHARKMTGLKGLWELRILPAYAGNQESNHENKTYLRTVGQKNKAKEFRRSL